MTELFQHRLPNGLWLVAERIGSMKSLALSLLLPAGVAHEPAEQAGVAPLLAEMICRGAGDRDARAHTSALEQLGVQRDTAAEMHHLRLSAVMLGDKVSEALPLLADMVRRPALPAAGLGPARDLALQALDALEDEPQQRVFVELRQRHYPQPFGRSTLGQRSALEALTIADVHAYWQTTFVPDGAILGVAGSFAWPELRDRVEELLGEWSGGRTPPADAAPAPRGYHHDQAETTQVHIGLAYEAVPESDQRSILAQSAVAVLSGGMSGRLFTEVREKRGLCYAVGARYAADQRRGAVLCYSGTTAPRAQETLDVLTRELRRLSEGIEPAEFERALVGMKSSLVMQGESSSARAAAIAADQFIHGRPRSLEELTRRVEGVTLPKLTEFVRAQPPGPMTVVTVGPEPLNVGGG